MSSIIVYNPVIATLIVFLIILSLLYVFNRLTAGICAGHACLVGKTAIVTGGNEGIGFETVLCLAARGARVIIADVADSTQTRLRVIEETENENVISMHLDLAEDESIRQFAKDFKALPDVRLDILINNAAVPQSNGRKNSSGIDYVMQVNYLGGFLLTHCVADVLKNTPGARILFVSSLLAFLANVTVTNLVEPHQFLNYSKTKFCMMIASNYFAKKFNKYGVTSNCVNPGLCDTRIHQLVRKGSILTFLYSGVVRLFARTALEGAQCVLDAATSHKWRNVSNNFFVESGLPLFKPIKYYSESFRQEIIDKTIMLVDLTADEENI